MRRHRLLVRNLRLLQLLEAARVGLTLRRLAEDTGYCQRTVRRDLEALQEAGIPIVQESGHRWRAMNWRKEAA